MSCGKSDSMVADWTFIPMNPYRTCRPCCGCCGCCCCPCRRWYYPVQPAIWVNNGWDNVPTIRYNTTENFVQADVYIELDEY